MEKNDCTQSSQNWNFFGTSPTTLWLQIPFQAWNPDNSLGRQMLAACGPIDGDGWDEPFRVARVDPSWVHEGEKQVVLELIASDSVRCLAELFIKVGFGSSNSFLIQLNSNTRLPCNTENLKHAPECKFWMFTDKYIITKLKWCHIGWFWHILAGLGGCLTKPRCGMRFWGHPKHHTTESTHIYIYIQSFIKLPLAWPSLGTVSPVSAWLGAVSRPNGSDPIWYPVRSFIHQDTCILRTFQALWDSLVIQKTAFWYLFGNL